jgi:hypothetical protein
MAADRPILFRPLGGLPGPLATAGGDDEGRDPANSRFLFLCVHAEGP